MGNSKLELYKFVNSVHNYFNIDYDSFPISTVNICNSLPNVELQYHPFKTNGFCAAILLGSKADTIVLNSNRSEAEKNFDCGHEIIHGTKHRNFGIDTFSCMELKSKNQSNLGFFEWEANEGSAQFLVPHYSLLPEIKKAYPFLKTEHDFSKFKSEMAEKYGVTESVINFRFESLKYEIKQYLDDVPLENIEILSSKQQSIKGIEVKSLNDIESEILHYEYHVYFRDPKCCIDIYK